MSKHEIVTREMVSCVTCHELFTDTRRCCCDSGTYLVYGINCHDEGYCDDCCPKHSIKRLFKIQIKNFKDQFRVLWVYASSSMYAQLQVEAYINQEDWAVFTVTNVEEALDDWR